MLWISTVVDFYAGRKIFESDSLRKRRWYLGISIACNLGMLGFFKYFGFFIDSASNLLSNLGLQTNLWTLKIILPIGISFYTFQTMSYSLDIFRNKLKPVKSFRDFALFVSFFPQLVAPLSAPPICCHKFVNIEFCLRARLRKDFFSLHGGYLKKMIIADNIAWIVNDTFGNYTSAGSWEILIAIYAFSIQIYCDFSGYSDIARGLANIMGFDLMVNFRLPYFASNMSEFWRRWHISLTSWLRDYLFIAIGGNRKGLLRTCMNTIIVFTVVGLWHGANWTFVLWGANFGVIQAFYIAIQPYLSVILPSKTVTQRRIVSTLGTFLVFNIVSINVLFFRSQSVGQAAQMIAQLFSGVPSRPQLSQMLIHLIFFSMPLITMQIFQAQSGNLLIFIKMKNVHQFAASLAGIILIAMLYLFGTHLHTGEEFIYFQF